MSEEKRIALGWENNRALTPQRIAELQEQAGILVQKLRGESPRDEEIR